MYLFYNQENYGNLLKVKLWQPTTCTPTPLKSEGSSRDKRCAMFSNLRKKQFYNSYFLYRNGQFCTQNSYKFDRSGQLFSILKDAQDSETYAQTIFRILFFEKLSILYSKF